MALYNKYGCSEVYFTFLPTDNRKVTLTCSALGLGQSEAKIDGWPELLAAVTKEISVAISTREISGITFAICEVYIGNTLFSHAARSLEAAAVPELNCKIIIAMDALSVYINEIWVYSYVFKELYWPEVPVMSLQGYSSISETLTITDIKRIELSDRREAVYVDYEATSDSAVQSIIQQRPIQIFPEVGRANAYTYSAIRDTLLAHHVISYEEQVRDNQQLSSDGLVYYLDVGISISRATAKAVGLITKLYRLSELDNGAITAASKIQKLALERRTVVSIAMRFDLRIEVGDVLVIDMILTGTGRHITDVIIVDDISLSLSNGNYLMNISGRRRY